MPKALAHNLDQSYLYFQVTDKTLAARAELPVKDLNEILKLGLPNDRKVSPEELQPHLEQIKSYVARNMDIQCAPQNCDLIFQKYDVLESRVQFLQLSYQVTGFQTRPDTVQARYDAILADKTSKYTNMVLIEQNWNAGTFGNEATPLLIFTEPGKTHKVEFAAGSFWQGFSTIVQLGINHILSGIDHVLFLVALLLPSVLRRQDDRWQPVEKFSKSFIYIIKIATAFTIAHSITLGLASLEIVNLPARLVESIIAASIGLAVIEIFYPIFKGRTWFVIFLFGLFHGFGFAEIMGELGITSQHAVLSLFGFNLGVEIGQLAIIAVVFPFLYLLRKQRFYPSLILKGGGLALGILSLYWFIERAFAVNLPVGPIVQGLMPG
ncbi:HupE/UreJ family protein [filamentous cyanobacterium LEGE 11480]|uniref:HupE/UreJ family protein n=1 Tax=Romeriopsis navalis LEGE 11480 TaxID=2777977 RepID=A0A928VMT1_9CYAN|nr:HupE/UreJ family protein [Romeriopsis navalis]MBE9028844.1 HupE/UreJ family protein [Romeriopsis navalis LEGE 11480]